VFGPVKLKPRNLHCQNCATALLAALILKFQLGFDEAADVGHHSLPRPTDACVHVAVVGIANEAMAAPLEFPIQLIQHHVGEQARADHLVAFPRQSG
jgi:hypothetical protein